MHIHKFKFELKMISILEKMRMSDDCSKNRISRKGSILAKIAVLNENLNLGEEKLDAATKESIRLDAKKFYNALLFP